jgi:hypothetical protein
LGQLPFLQALLAQDSAGTSWVMLSMSDDVRNPEQKQRAGAADMAAPARKTSAA